MRLAVRRSKGDPAAGSQGTAQRNGSTGPQDTLIAAAICVLTAAAGVAGGMHFHQQAAHYDILRLQSQRRSDARRAGLRHLEARRVALVQLRHDVDHYVAEVAARPILPWSTAVSELSRRRPKGVWTTVLSGDGPRFRAEIVAANPALVQRYTAALRDSPYVDFAAPPAAPLSGRTQVVGRWTGE